MFSDMVLFIFVRFFTDFWRFWRKNGKKWKVVFCLGLFMRVFLNKCIYAE